MCKNPKSSWVIFAVFLDRFDSQLAQDLFCLYSFLSFPPFDPFVPFDPFGLSRPSRRSR